MKPINKDAKLLIRSYIDNIEEYLTTKSKMHPNIIDGILNEINDFIYIRSAELAKDTIAFSDVLKAMEECGSPSDICEQYLEDEVIEGRQDATDKIDNDKSKTLLGKKIADPSDSPILTSTSQLTNSNFSYLDQLGQFPLFGFYRICSLFLYLVMNFFFISRIFIFTDHYDYSLHDMHLFCWNAVVMITMLPSIFFLVEGWLVNDWKHRNKIRGFDRTKDDNVVIAVSRFSILILLIKSSLLPLPQYFIVSFTFLLILIIWLERQHSSSLWTSKISKKINNIAHSLEEGKFLSNMKKTLNNWLCYLNSRKKSEKIYFLSSVFLLLFNWLFPWIYGWVPLYIPIEILLDLGISFNPSYLISGFIIQHLLPFSLLFGGIFITNVLGVNGEDSKNKLTPANIWIVRIVVLRTLLMPLSYNIDFNLSVTTFFLVVSWLLFEFSVNKGQNRLLVQTIVNGLKFLGSERTPYVKSINIDPSTDISRQNKGDNRPIKADLTKLSIQDRKQRSYEPRQVIYDENVPLIDYQSPIVKFGIVVFPAIFRFTKKAITLCLLAIYSILKPIYTLGKSLTITCILLFGSILEVLLLIVAFLTQLGTDGSYLVPQLTFDLNLHPINESMYTFGGFVIWSWYVLGILAAQIFIIVVIEWLQFARKRNDGVIMVFFRSFSRILLLIIAFGSIIQGLFYFDIYAPLRLFSIIILVIFMEITSLKIRIERRNWKLTTTNSQQEIESKTTGTQTNSE